MKSGFRRIPRFGYWVIVMKKRWLLLIVLTLFGAGCAHPEPESSDFALIADELDFGGDSFKVVTGGRVGALLNRLAAAMNAAVCHPDSPGFDSADRFSAGLAAIRLAGHVAGLEAVAGHGSSSLVCGRDSAGAPLFLNRTFLLLRSPREHPMWLFFDGPAAVTAEDLADFPGSAILAGVARIRPSAVLTRMRLAPRMYGVVTDFCRRKLGASPEELLSGLDGRWRMAVAAGPDEGPETDGFLVMLEFPDRGRRISGMMKERFLAGRVKNNRAALPGVGGALHIEFTADSVVLSFPRRAGEWFSAPASRLGGNPDFRDLADRLPESTGQAVFFISPRMGDFGDSRFFGQDVVWSEFMSCARLSLLTLRPDGIATATISGMSVEEELAAAFIIAPQALLSGQVPDSPGQASAPAQTGEAAAPAGPAAAEDDSAPESCRNELLRLYRGLAETARAGSGAFPETCVTGGTHRYLYFPGWRLDSNPDLPLLIDLPGNHPGYFNMLSVDGRVHRIAVERLNNVKRAVGALQSQFGYSGADFNRLVRLAGEADRSLKSKDD